MIPVPWEVRANVYGADYALRIRHARSKDGARAKAASVIAKIRGVQRFEVLGYMSEHPACCGVYPLSSSPCPSSGVPAR